MQDVTITLRVDWEMGHRLPLHEGKCRRLHGHHYVAEISVTGPVQTEGPATGMVVDFYDVKKHVKEILDVWDHRTMLYEGDELARLLAAHMLDDSILLCSFHPTAENIAVELMKRLQRALAVTKVRVYETPNGWVEVMTAFLPPTKETL